MGRQWLLPRRNSVRIGRHFTWRACTGHRWRWRLITFNRALSLFGQHNNIDPAVDRVERLLGIKQLRRSKTHHPRHLRVRVAAGHQRTPGGVGAVGREFPVAEVALPRIWLGIGMAADADLVRHCLDRVGHGQQDVFKVRLQPRTAGVEHRPVGGVGDLDAQAVRGDLERNLILEFQQLRVFVNLGLQLLQQQFEALLLDLFGQAFNGFALDRNVFLRCLSLDLRVDGALRRQLRRTAQVDHEGRAAFRETNRVFEVTGDGDLLLGGRGGHQPQHQEERHHRRCKVGEGDFPGAAMVPRSEALDALDDYRLVVFHGLATANRLFQLGKTWAMFRVQHLAPELHRQRWRHTGRRSHQARLDRFVEVDLFLGIMGQAGSERSKETIGRQNTEECTDEGRTHVHANGLLVAFAQGRHGHHNTEYRRDNTKPGHGVSNAGHGVRRVFQLFFKAEQLHVEQAFQLVRRHVAGGHDAQVITDVGGHALIFEHGRVLGENRAGGGVFDIAFDGHHAFAAALVEDLEYQTQHFQVKGVGETRAEHAQRLLDHMHGHVAGVGLQECAECRAANNHHFEGLDQRSNLAVRQDIATEHTCKNDDDADYFSHRGFVLAPSGSWTYLEELENSCSTYRQNCDRL